MIGALVWRNLWRNRRRTFITMSSVMFAVLLAVVLKSMQAGVFDNLIKSLAGAHSGYIQIHRSGYWDEQNLDNSFALDDSLLAALRGPAAGAPFTPRIEAFVLASSGNTTRGCLVVGADPDGEVLLTQLDRKMSAGAYFRKNTAGALVAEGLARRLAVQPGDTLVLLGQGYHGSPAAGKYRVSGLVHFGAPQLNDALVYLPLPTAQVFFDADGRATALAFGLDDPGRLYEVEQALQAAAGPAYEVMTWEEMMPEIKSHIEADNLSFYLEIGILYLVIAFGIFGTVLMMTAERRYEFGMLIAIGMRKWRLGLVLLGESVLLTLLGALAGAALSLPVVWYFKINPIRFSGEFAETYARFGFEPIFPTALDASIFITQTAIVLVIALLVGLYPMLHLWRLDAVTAMKR